MTTPATYAAEALTLYTYFRSSASYRVRIALNLKALTYASKAIHLVRDGGEQLSVAYRALNPDGLVPALVLGAAADPADTADTAGDGDGDGAALPSAQILTQSLAIIEYLDESYPAPPLLPASAIDRAWVRSIALAIACDIHPVNNLRILRYLSSRLNVTEHDKDAWYRHWCEQGLAALEVMLARDPRVGRFCFGDTPSLADCCLVPQVFNAQRFNCELKAMPTVLRINDACLELDAFQRAMPSRQEDAQ